MNPADRLHVEADEVRRLGLRSYAEIERRPALRSLLQAAMARIESAIPATLEHEGKTYFLCVRIASAELGIHAAPGEVAPLVHVMAQGGRWAGHRPGS